MNFGDVVQPICECPATANVMDVAAAMRDSKCGAAVLIDPAGLPIGVITDHDLTTEIVATGKDSYYVPATELARKVPICAMHDNVPATAIPTAPTAEHAVLVLEQGKTIGLTYLLIPEFVAA